MNITYLGQCGFLLEIGEARIVTDPYLSNYVDKMSADGTMWRRLYPAPAQLNELKPDAIVISHSHGDHLDPWTLEPYIQAGGTALIAAPAPECGLLEKLGAKNIEYAEADRSFTVKGVKITPIPCAHTELHQDEQGRYRELSYILECGEEKLFFGGDMSLYPGLVERLEREACQIVLLPANGRDEERTAQNIIGNINHIEAAQLAAHLKARAYIPMHFDLYANNGCPVEDIEAAAREYGANLRVMKPGERWENA